MARRYSVSDIAEIVGGRVRGDGDVEVCGVAGVEEAGPTDIVFVSRTRYARLIDTSRAAAVLVPVDFRKTPMPAILCEHIQQAVAKLLGAFKPSEGCPASGVHPSAVIDAQARLGGEVAIGAQVVVEAGACVGDRCQLHAGSFVGREAVIGNDCVLWPGAVVCAGCELGERVTLYPNAVIGSDGFGYYFQDGRYHKVPHAGKVVLGDDVEIGACSCVDRSKFGATHIGRGTKIDNLVQIAHNVRIGEHAVFPAFCVIGGSARVGNYVVSGGCVGIIDNVTVGDRVRLAGGDTLATKDIPDDATVSGSPARDHREKLREQALIARLPEMVKQLKVLAARVEELETSMHDSP